MKTERNDVEHPLWRKKVDKSLFDHGGTVVPGWVGKQWNLTSLVKARSNKAKEARVTITFDSKGYEGSLTISTARATSPLFRLWFAEDLTLQLKRTFLMSHMRALEERLSGELRADIENKIPFWEFLDIEFDSSRRHFKFSAHYQQQPTFPNLFHRLVESPALKNVYDEIEGKVGARIHKQNWQKRTAVAFELYVGQAADLRSRLREKTHPTIPDWDYRYDRLPESLIGHRVPLERMMIRVMAFLIPNDQHANQFPISEYRLTNRMIDK
jgi:hypothetical protein